MRQVFSLWLWLSTTLMWNHGNNHCFRNEKALCTLVKMSFRAFSASSSFSPMMQFVWADLNMADLTQVWTKTTLEQFADGGNLIRPQSDPITNTTNQFSVWKETELMGKCNKFTNSSTDSNQRKRVWKCLQFQSILSWCLTGRLS